MTIDLMSLLGQNGMLLLFTVIGVGYLLGNVKIAGIEGGPVVGVLLMGLVFGHLGFTAPEGASTFGFALFIFSVGIQAGPTFFRVISSMPQLPSTSASRSQRSGQGPVRTQV
jgi:putative transport protein